MRWRERGGVRWLEAELPGARAAFTSRVGGVSEGPFESLNLGLLTGDEAASVRENRRRTAAALAWDPAGILFGRQVHGPELERRDAPPGVDGFTQPGLAPAEVDGQVTSSPALTPLVFVADCLPVALAGPRGVAMIHCGWRGLAEGIVARGAAAVEARAAAIGPGIGPCCYEVGEEVLERFRELGDGLADGRMLDLREAAHRLLRNSGVTEVEVAGECTSCQADLFFSHRREGGRTGRQAGLVRMVR